MPEETNGDSSRSRLDRMERIVEVLVNTQADLQQDVKILLRAQVVIGDQMKEGFAKLTEAQQHTEERLNALITVVDEIVRRQSPPS